MKPLTAALLVGLFMTTATPALAWDLPGVPKADDPAVTQLKQQNGALLKTTHAATVSILDSLALLQKAAGDTAEAERITALAAKFKAVETVDVAALQAAAAEVKALSARLVATEFPERALSEDEQLWAHQALAGLGAALAADGHVAKEALMLTAEAGKVGEKLLRKNPLALGGVKDATSSAQFVAEFAGEQAATLKVIHDATLRFAKSHHIDPPTPEQIQRAYQALKTRMK